MEPLPTPGLPPKLPPPAKRSFQLSLVVLVLWAVYAAVIVGAFVLRLRAGNIGNAPREIGGLVGELVASFLLPAALAWLFWRICRRSPVAANATFGVVLALSIGGEIKRANDRRETAARISQFEQDAKRFEAERKQTLVRGGKLDAKRADEFARHASEQMREAAQSASTNRERRLAEAARAYTDSIRDAKQRYDEATAGVEFGTFWDLDRLATPEQVEQRRRAVRRYEAANRLITPFYDGKGTVFRRALETGGVDAKDTAEAMDEYLLKASGARGQALLKIRECDTRLAAAMMEFLDFADTRRGKWAKNEAGKLRFADDADRAAYNDIITRTKAIANEQAQYQRLAAGVTP